MSYLGKHRITKAASAALQLMGIEPERLNMAAVDEIAKNSRKWATQPLGEPDEAAAAIAEMMMRTLQAASLVQAPDDPAPDELARVQMTAAVQIGRAQAILRLVDIPDKAMNCPLLDRALTLWVTGQDPLAPIQDWIHRWSRDLDVRPAADDHDTFFGHHVMAYLAGSLTNSSPEDGSRFMEWQEMAAWQLAKIGIRSYIPGLHTDPKDAPDLDNAVVHDTDHAKVLAVDLIVAFGEPSLGTGKELAWADSTGAIEVIVQLSEKPVSRLPLGTTAHRKFIPLSDLKPQFDAMFEFVAAHRERLIFHAFLRKPRGTLEPLCDRLRAVEQATVSRIEQDPRSLLSPRRAREIASDSQFMFHATVRELRELALHSGVDLSDAIPGRDQQLSAFPLIETTTGEGQRTLLTDEEFGMLEVVAQEEGWSTRRVIELIRRAESPRPVAHAPKRAPLRTYKAWIDFDMHRA